MGDKFDTDWVSEMASMFYSCKFPDGFTLGDNFTTKNVENMRAMFKYCEFPEGFTLGRKFDTTNVDYMQSMFAGCRLPAGFTLGKRFSVNRGVDTTYMFYDCTLDGEYLDDKDDKDIIKKLSEGKLSPRDDVLDRLLDIPFASIKNCESIEELVELIKKYL